MRSSEFNLFGVVVPTLFCTRLLTSGTVTNPLEMRNWSNLDCLDIWIYLFLLEEAAYSVKSKATSSLRALCF
nr:MAG TPA: hypothetical protein [Caudoviricetes sp.]